MEWLLNYCADAGLWFADKLGSVVDAFPHVPSAITDAIDRYLCLIFQYADWACFFVDIDFVKVVLPWFMVVMYCDKSLKGINWVLSKVPFVGSYFQSN